MGDVFVFAFRLICSLDHVNESNSDRSVRVRSGKEEGQLEGFSLVVSVLKNLTVNCIHSVPTVLEILAKSWKMKDVISEVMVIKSSAQRLS